MRFLSTCVDRGEILRPGSLARLFARLHFHLTRFACCLRAVSIPLFCPAIEFQDASTIGRIVAHLPEDGATFLGKPITVLFATGIKTFLGPDRLITLSRPIPIRHLRWLRVLLAQFPEVIPTIL